ncbi:hypothetical protein DSO57_1037806 [Entomophthora muscae]|uniref:Uncharacterized protein n=1 Tax=Entomophthora muscae TaxID=34485 RepID=A0ACC2SBT5_9FUNG|nr:hypothetical protein DSO57_1037806 [Entomophthora muscae]
MGLTQRTPVSDPLPLNNPQVLPIFSEQLLGSHMGYLPIPLAAGILSGTALSEFSRHIFSCPHLEPGTGIQLPPGEIGLLGAAWSPCSGKSTGRLWCIRVDLGALAHTIRSLGVSGRSLTGSREGMNGCLTLGILVAGAVLQDTAAPLAMHLEQLTGCCPISLPAYPVQTEYRGSLYRQLFTRDRGGSAGYPYQTWIPLVAQEYTFTWDHKAQCLGRGG